MTEPTAPIIIAGGGIAGLACGVALERSGHRVRVLERSTRENAAGAGLSLWPNAIRALRELGLADAVIDVGASGFDGRLHNAAGRVLATTSARALEERFSEPLVVIHRDALLRLLRGALSPGSVEAGTEVVAVRAEGDGAVARLADGNEIAARLLVGADGIRSRVRAAICKDNPVRGSGLVAWRGIVRPRGDVPEPGESWGRAALFGLAPLGRGQVYWWASARCDDDAAAPEVERERLVERLAGFPPEVASLVTETPADALIRTPLEERRPLRSWTAGPVGLVGDAAHPMLPFLGQGACQALEDAVALSAALARSPEDVPGALRDYERLRRKSALLAVRRSQRMGRLAHLRSRSLIAARDALLRAVPDAAGLRALDPLLAP